LLALKRITKQEPDIFSGYTLIDKRKRKTN
jgi:hypothetical protein